MITRTRLSSFAALCALLGLLLPARVACPQNALQPAAATISKTKSVPPPGASDERNKRGSEGDRVHIEQMDSIRYEPASSTFYARGNVVFAHKDVHVYCDEGDYHEDTDKAEARGHLRATDPSSTVTGDLMEADFGRELVIITGNVTILTRQKENQAAEGKGEVSQRKPKATGKPAGDAKPAADGNAPGDTAKPPTADKTKPDKQTDDDIEEMKHKLTTITCERVEYWYADDVKRMIATPRVKAVQEGKTAWADRAVYDDISRLVTLTGNVIVKTDKGDEMHCTKVVVSVDDDTMQAEGGVGGVHAPEPQRVGQGGRSADEQAGPGGSARAGRQGPGSGPRRRPHSGPPNRGPDACAVAAPPACSPCSPGLYYWPSPPPPAPRSRSPASSTAGAATGMRTPRASRTC